MSATVAKGKPTLYYMENVIICPQCSHPVVAHCDHCQWLACTTCKVIFGKNAFILYGEARSRQDEARKRQNGV